VIGPGDPHIADFRAAVTRWLGLEFDDSKDEFLAGVVRRRAAARNLSREAYLAGLRAGAPPASEQSALARELTINETYFFRHPAQFEAFRDEALPDRMRARDATRQLRVTSLGCSTGEEPYSLAILLDDVRRRGWDVAILGVDLDPTVLERARRGRYTAWSLRETSPEVQQRWFRVDGDERILDERVRTAVTFVQHNLASDEGDLWRAESHDVIFCRNVLMYFGAEAMLAAVDRITRALAPGGYLFLGHAETLRGLSTEFHLHHTQGTFYYQRHDRPGTPRPAGRSPAAPARTDWPDAIEQAAARIRAMTDALPSPRPSPSPSPRPSPSPHPSPSPSPHPSPSPLPAPDLSAPLDLLRQERFGDALTAMTALPADRSADPDALLLEAILLTHQGRLGEAEVVCRRLLELDELSAGAHHVLSLCKDGNGDRAGAIEHDQIALYLDPTLAMARLHLGLLARRGGDVALARRELAEALVLLQREETSRLLLFGGGFRRDALVTLCRGELAAVGGGS
jgi:chemotaxis protein methyltransferase CheR